VNPEKMAPVDIGNMCFVTISSRDEPPAWTDWILHPPVCLMVPETIRIQIEAVVRSNTLLPLTLSKAALVIEMAVVDDVAADSRPSLWLHIVVLAHPNGERHAG